MNKNKKKNKFRIEKILIGLAAFLVSFCMIVGFVAIILYKSGENAIKADALGTAPSMITSIEEQETAKQDLLSQNIVTWKDNWVPYESDIYEYNENVLNFLIIGIDHAGELNKNTDLSDWSAGQADTIFLISLHKDNKSISVIGIPRNSMVELDIYNEEKKKIDTIYNQICLQYGYAGGGQLGLEEMKSSVSKLFYDLPIHGICAMSFDAIAVVADMIGGVDIIIPDDLTDCNKKWTQGANVHLTKSNIMTYLRYRGTAFKGSNQRLSRQKEFMKAAMAQGMSRVKENPGIVADIYQAILPYINTDITVEKATYIAVESLGYSVGNDNFYQLTGENVEVPKTVIDIEGYDSYDDFYIDEDALKRLMLDVYYDKVVLDTIS